MSRLLRFAFLAVFSACNSSSGSTLQVTLGGETDTVTRDPAIASFVIEAVDRSGNRQQLKEAAWVQGSAVDLGEISQTAVASVQLTGLDASGNAIVWGATPFALLGAFTNSTVPLFVQRKGEFARMPGTIADGRNVPLLARTARAIYFAGGTGTSGLPVTGAYDLLTLQGFGTTLTPNRTATSFGIVQLTQATTDGDIAIALLIDDAGVDEVGLATEELYNDVNSLDVTWSELAGGRTVVSPEDNTVYILGPSKFDGHLVRKPHAGSRVTLRLTPAGTSTIVKGGLRQGAAVAWSPNHAVFVYGGSAIEAGAEVITDTSSPLPYPPDPTPGLAAIAFDETHMLIAGDGNAAHLIDVTCTAQCAKVPWGKMNPPALSAATLFALGQSVFFLVGDDASGSTHAYRITQDAVVEKPLKIARTGGRAIQAETGQIIVFGGGSATPESYVD